MAYAIGKIKYTTSTFGQIEVLFREQNGVWTSEGISEVFPPNGCVFGPSLGSDYPGLKEDSVVRFNYVENEEVDYNDDSKDQFIVPQKSAGGSVRQLIRILMLSPETIYSRKSINDSSELIFFERERNAVRYLCGPLWARDLSPQKGKEVGAWPFCFGWDVINYRGQSYLVTDVGEFIGKKTAFMVDCMSTEQLYREWFKKKFKELLSADVLKCIHDKLQEIENGIDDELEKERFKRIASALASVNLTYEEIRQLNGIPEFQKRYQIAVKENIDAILEKEGAALAERKKILAREEQNCKEKLGRLAQEIDRQEQRFHKRTSELEAGIARMEEAYTKKEASLKVLDEHRKEFVELIRLQTDLSGSVASGSDSLAHSSWHYPLECISHDSDARVVEGEADKKAFCGRILELYRKDNMREALNRLRYPAIQTGDIRNGIFLAAMLGNSIYELCQPSPKWLTFEDFWRESLQPIWDSAHRSPEIWHFLLIENFNLALPECWGRPLWNMFDEYITLLPCAKTALLPKNLRVIVSFAPSQSDDHSHLGLPTQVGSSWPNLSIGDNWDDWFDFASDKYQGLAINEEFYYPVLKNS